MKFTEKMSARWSIATFQQQQRKMSLYEFKLHMEFCGYETYGRKVLRFYKEYEKKISEQHLRVSKLREQRINGTKKKISKDHSKD